jgi:hypothetical protein
MVKTRKGREYHSSPQNSSTTPARKLKNKVGSPAAASRATQGSAAKAVVSSAPVEDDTHYHTSDEFEFSEEDEPRPPRSAAAVASQSSGERRTKLSLNPKRALLTDTQRAGGIDKFHLESSQALSSLCDTRPALYGARGDKIRTQIRKKVFRWKNLDKASWFELLLSQKVTETPRKESQAVNSGAPEANHIHAKAVSSVTLKIPTVITASTISSKPAATSSNMAASEKTRKWTDFLALLSCTPHLLTCVLLWPARGHSG